MVIPPVDGPSPLRQRDRMYGNLVRLGLTALVGLAACSDDPGPTAGTSDTSVAATDASQHDAATCPAHGCPCTDNLDCGGLPCVEGQCDALQCKGQPDGRKCDDGDACTKSDLCAAGKCVGADDVCDCRTTADCKAREDADKCNGTLYCNTDALPFHCLVNPSTPVTCPDLGKPCHANVCAPASGTCALQPTADADCDDADPCTEGERCDATGKCVGGTKICACDKDADCADKEDGNPCTGTLYCDKDGAKSACKPNPATVKKCAQTGVGPCKKNACQPATGACAVVPVGDGTACSDGKACTANDACKAGTCEAGGSVCPCNSHADCAKHEDGDLCNGTLYCHAGKGSCELNPATLVTCPTTADTACLHSACQPATGLCKAVPRNDGKVCDDGDACTKSETCAAGKCAATAGVCACKTNADCKAHEDGNACNGTLYCDKLTTGQNCAINPATVVSCAQDDAPCTTQVCQPATGTCKPANLPATVTCTDSNKCTAGDHCQAGACVPGTGTCACTKNADCAKADDGDACNGVLFCDATDGKCKLNPATIKTCPSVDDTACKRNKCEPKTGVCKMTAAADNAACDDGDACTKGDACHSGTCGSGLNVCTCKAQPDCDKLDDGDLCNGTRVCKLTGTAGVCEAAPPVICKGGGSACTAIGCYPPSGKCVPLPKKDGAVCDDGDPCTKADACKSGGCTPGAPVAGCCLRYVKVAKKGGSKLADRFVSAAPLGSGAVVCGNAQSTKGPFDVRVVRLDVKGNKLWDRIHAPEVATKACSRVAVAGNLVVVAATSFHGNKGQDAWFLGLDPGSGLQKWSRWWGGSGHDYGTDVAVSAGLIGFAVYDRTTTAKLSRARVQALDSSGTTKWGEVLSSTKHSVDKPALAAGAGGGWLLGYGGPDPGTSAGQGYVLKGLDAAGKSLWTRYLPGSGSHMLRRIVGAPGGGWAMVGRGAAAGGKTGCRFVTVDKDGKVGPSLAWLAGDKGECHDMTLLGDGSGYAVAGHTVGTQGWLGVVEPAGKLKWGTKLGGAGNDRLFGVAVPGSGGGLLFVGGLAEPGSKFHDDGWLVRTDNKGKTTCD